MCPKKVLLVFFCLLLLFSGVNAFQEIGEYSIVVEDDYGTSNTDVDGKDVTVFDEYSTQTGVGDYTIVIGKATFVVSDGIDTPIYGLVPSGGGSSSIPGETVSFPPLTNINVISPIDQILSAEFVRGELGSVEIVVKNNGTETGEVVLGVSESLKDIVTLSESSDLVIEPGEEGVIVLNYFISDQEEPIEGQIYIEGFGGQSVALRLVEKQLGLNEILVALAIILLLFGIGFLVSKRKKEGKESD